MHIGPIHEHWDDTQLPCLSGGTCVHLGPGNPNVHKEVGNPKVFNQVEGIALSRVWLVGKGLDSAAL